MAVFPRLARFLRFVPISPTLFLAPAPLTLEVSSHFVRQYADLERGSFTPHDSTPFCRPADPPRLERGCVVKLRILSLALLSLAALGSLSRKITNFCADHGQPCADLLTSHSGSWHIFRALAPPTTNRAETDYAVTFLTDLRTRH